VSKSKGTALKQRWIGATRSNRCPICGSDSWCAIRQDGAVVTCRRNGTGTERVDRSGAVYWLHWRTEAERAPVQPAPPTKDRANVQDLDRAYRALLAKLGLTDKHRADLERRGLSAELIKRGEYRTLPLNGRSALANAICEVVSDPASIPGVYQIEDSGRYWWTLAGSPGLVIPVRDTQGLIVALKIRKDDGEGPKYLYLSSSSKGGPSALHSVHVPVGIVGTHDLIRVTEGELKADIASALGGAPCVSVPGVQSWGLAFEAIHALGAKIVEVAFDADVFTNVSVKRAAHSLLKEIAARGLQERLIHWPAEQGKGIDDAIVYRLRAGEK